MKDLRDEDPQRRYKMFMKEKGVSVEFSPDGLHWSNPIRCPEIDAAADTHNNTFWAPELERYVVGSKRVRLGLRVCDCLSDRAR